MKRILFASWYSGLGGGETDLLFLAESLDPRRFECHLVLPNEGQLSERWRAKGWHSHIVPFRGASTLFVPAIWARFPIVDRFATLLKQESIDIVHSDYHSLPMMASAAGRAGVPILFTLWGWWFKPKSWQRKFFQDIPAIIARSMAIRDGFLGSPPFMPTETIPVIYSGVDINRFNPDIGGKYLRDEIGIPGDCPVIAMVARFQRVKGHHTFQALAETIAAQIPQAPFCGRRRRCLWRGCGCSISRPDSASRRRKCATARSPALHRFSPRCGTCICRGRCRRLPFGFRKFRQSQPGSDGLRQAGRQHQTWRSGGDHFTRKNGHSCRADRYACAGGRRAATAGRWRLAQPHGRRWPRACLPSVF